MAMTPSAETTKEEAAKEEAADLERLIPGLPDEVAEQCLLHLPFPYQALARSVSSAWNRELSSPAFLRAKAELSAVRSLPYLFAFAFHPTSLRLQWQALDPRTRRWFVLPPMPLPADGAAPICPPAFACAALPNRGEIYVLGGMRSDTETPLRALVTYRATTNSWSTAAPMPTPRSFFSAEAIGGRIFTAGGGDRGISEVECYDPEADRWLPVAGMQCGMALYDPAVVGRRMYVTEGWQWPFYASPRAGVYNVDLDTWEGMRAKGCGRVGRGPALSSGTASLSSPTTGTGVKVYDAGSDAWRGVEGSGVPPALRRPYAVGGVDGEIFMVGSGLEVGVGMVVAEAEGEKERMRIVWEVVKGPPAFADLVPCYSQALYG